MGGQVPGAKGDGGPAHPSGGLETSSRILRLSAAYEFLIAHVRPSEVNGGTEKFGIAGFADSSTKPCRFGSNATPHSSMTAVKAPSQFPPHWFGLASLEERPAFCMFGFRDLWRSSYGR